LRLYRWFRELQTQATRSRLSKREALVVLFGAAILMAFRFPDLVLHPRFWAEEGAVFFANARRLPAVSFLFTPHIGYALLLTKAAALMATAVPLEWGPAVTTLLALLVQLIPFAIVLAGRSSLWNDARTQLMATLVLLFVLPNRENWLNTTGSQFVLSLAVFLLALEDRDPGTRAGLVARLALIVLAGLTGPTSCLLLPALAWRWFRMRTTAALGLALALLACSLVQFAFLFDARLVSAGELARRRSGIRPPLLAEIIFIKDLALPLLGIDRAEILAGWLYDLKRWHGLISCIALALYLAVLALALAGISREARIPLILGLAALIVASTVFSLDDKTPLLFAMPGERYYQAPNAALFIALASGVRGRPWPSVARAVLVAMAIGVGLTTFPQHYWFFEDGPDWRAEIARWRADPSVPPKVWPQGWIVQLK